MMVSYYEKIGLLRMSGDFVKANKKGGFKLMRATLAD